MPAFEYPALVFAFAFMALHTYCLIFPLLLLQFNGFKQANTVVYVILNYFQPANLLFTQMFTISNKCLIWQPNG